MMVNSRMVKPHMVKKWARPGTVHCRSLRCPATSVTSASALRLIGPRVREGSGLPDLISLDSQWNRRGGDAEAGQGDTNAQNDPDRHKCSSPRCGTSNGGVAGCERHLGLQAAQRIVWRPLAGVVQRQNISFPS